MKLSKLTIALSCSIAVLTLYSCSSNSDNNPNKSTTNKIVVKTKPIIMNANMSYVTGYESGKNISLQGLNLNSDKVTQGFKDAITNAKPKLSENEISESMDSLKDKLIKNQLKKLDNNKDASSAFIEKISQIKNITEVNDEVYFQVIKQGDGKKPNSNSIVTISYKGTTPVPAYEKDNSMFSYVESGKLIGKSFDLSINATFPLTNLITCWQDAIPEIKTGTTVLLYCAPDVAYGASAPAAIGPNQALSFEITLKSFK